MMESEEGFEFVENATLADIAIYCKAFTLEKLYAFNAEAFLHICLENPNDLNGKIDYRFSLQHQSLDLLLVKFLNELIFIKDTQGIVCKPVHVEIEYGQAGSMCTAQLIGDYIINYRINVDPKAATLHKARCEKTNLIWESFIIIDV
jgi:SHS2 domain-containing protein